MAATPHDVAARLDRLPWSPFHRRMVFALGIAWILDGLEVTLVGSLAPILRRPQTLGLSAQGVGFVASSYLLGAVLGSLLFGYLADRSGRKRLFTVTLLLYITATAASGLAWNIASLALCRFLTGAGIGGEYSAINSAIQELVPAERRGRIDIVINGSFWLGAAGAAALSLLLLNPAWLPLFVGWRLAFAAGATLGLIALVLRSRIPESPRWLVGRGREREALDIVTALEGAVYESLGRAPPWEPVPDTPRTGTRFIIKLTSALRIVWTRYPKRAILGTSLMASQAFFYNAFFFTYGLVLVRFYHVPAPAVGLYILPFALSNFGGAALLARFFDTVGRRPMMIGTYMLSGLLMIVSALLFRDHALTVIAQTGAWAIIFFFASAGASGAYLTVSESFPVEIRASAIALFYALGTAIGGVLAPSVFAALIATGSRRQVFNGYLLGASLMLLGALAEWFFGIAAEGLPLEALSTPLSQRPQDAPAPNAPSSPPRSDRNPIP